MKRSLHLVVSLLSVWAWADFRQGSTVVIPKGTTVAEDLYVTGGTVELNGVVNGDVAVAAAEVRVNGLVKGDLLVWGGRAVVAGVVEGSVRGLVGQLEIPGSVERDVVVGGGSLALSPAGAVGRDVMVAGGTVALEGSVARDVRATAGQMTLNGSVGGSVSSTAQALTLGEKAAITGDVSVKTPTEIARAPGATVAGKLERVETPAAGARVTGGLLVFGRRLFVFLMVALLWRLLFPGFSRRAAEALKAHPARALGYGALAAAIVPAVVLIAFVTGVFLGGWWLSLVGGGLFMVVAAIGVPLVGHLVAQRVAKWFSLELRDPAAQVLGILALTAVFSIPVVGWLAGLVVTLFGLGGQLLALPGRIRITSDQRLDSHPGSLRAAVPT